MLINADLAAVGTKDMVVVANNRQVLAFKNTWALQQGSSQLPKVFSWQQYLHHSYGKIQSKKRLINSIESRALMAKSIKKLGQNLNNALLDEVFRNYDYLGNHLITNFRLTQSKVPSSILFAQWITRYQQTKTALNLIDIHDLPHLIIGQQKKCQKIWIYGFKTLTPQQQKLFDSLGYQVLKTNNLHQHSCLSFDTSIDEIKAVAQWAKAHLDTNPCQSMAIVCPFLGEQQHQLKSIFDRVFDDLLIETGQKSYNISLGLSLSQYALVQDLLAILALSAQIITGEIQASLFSQVLKSVYVSGFKQEKSARHLAVNQVLAYAKTTLTLDNIILLLNECPQLQAIITRIKPTVDTSLEQHLLVFNTWLEIWGFATDRNLNSTEYQLFNKYLETSLTLNQLTLYQQNLDTYQAVETLKEVMNQVVFQAQSSKAPIQILGTLEAEGLHFEQAWVLGMTDQFLPAKLNTPRFIPHDISNQHQIPHTTYALIATDAKNTMNNLNALADTVIFSYALEHLGYKQLPSPMLSFDTPIQVISKHSAPAIEREEIEDFSASKLHNMKIKSGVTTLKDQMACAFKGFAHRLNIEHFETPHIGLDKREQGNIVHHVLQMIYQKIDSKNQLLNLEKTTLQTLVLSKIDIALKRYPSSGFQTVERIRLEKLIYQFIKNDKLRANFHVLDIEKSIDVNVAGLKFTTRIDRLDEMQNGDKIVFDYKTSPNTVASWCAEAIREPQLPIYAITSALQGAAFIELSSNKIQFKGLSKDKDSLPKQTNNKNNCKDWEQQVQIWQTQLNTASLNFQNAHAHVLPDKIACHYCELGSLCRVER